jgi:hypothetical protein
MDKRIIVPRIVVRPILPPPLEIGARIRPQWLHWQVGRYREKLSFGPGGEGKAKVWVPEKEGEQHNLILDYFYDTIIPNHGFIGASQYAVVGRGSTEPDPSQIQLASEFARSNTLPDGESNEIEALPTHGEYIIRRVVEFSFGGSGGINLTEWGFTPGNLSTGLMTRELFRDGSGNPVVLTLTTDQKLRLIYRYKVTVSPTSPQDVAVNIGGDGPGIRTGKFLLTGRIGNVSTPYFGVRISSDLSYAARRGDLIIADVLARAGTRGGVGTAGVSSNAAPLTYIHSTTRVATAEPNKNLSYSAPVGRSRTALILFQNSEANITIKSVILNSNMSSSLSTDTGPGGNLVFDNGQEFTKDNLHKLLIAYWQITWGP